MARSRPIDVCGPCPGSTTMSSASGRTRSRRLSCICGCDPPVRSVRPIEPANRKSPENISSETSLGPVVGDPVDDRSRRVTGHVVDGERQSVDLDLRAVGGVADVVGLGELRHLGQADLHAQHRGRLTGDRGHRVAQQVSVGRVDPHRAAVLAGDVLDAPHVVEVSVRDQHRRRREVVLGDDRVDPFHRVHAGVDERASGARSTRDDVAVGLQRAGREGGEEHDGQGTRVRRAAERAGPPTLAG